MNHFFFVFFAVAVFVLLLIVPFAGAQKTSFVDVGGKVGLADVKAFRTGWADVNRDGWPDILILHGKDTDLRALRIFLNRPGKNGGRRFEEAKDALGLLVNRDPKKEGRCVRVFVVGDVNNDGWEDVFTGAYCDLKKPKVDKQHRVVRDAKNRPVLATPDHGDRNEVLLGDGNGRFKLGPRSDLQKNPDTVCAAAWLDVDRDGLLDLFTGAWYEAYGLSMACYPDRLFLGRGDGQFKDVSAKAGLLKTSRKGTRAAHRPTYGVAHTDWDNDGDQDILVCAYGRQWNLLWRNNGDGTFTDVAADTGFDGDEDRSGQYPAMVRRPTESPFRSNGNTFDAAVADFDNDGDMDVFLAEICHFWAGPASDRSCLLVNQGPDGKYKFSRERRGIERKHKDDRWNEGDIHAGWLDFDNDGLLDLLLASSDYPDDQFLRLFQQKPDHTFQDVTRQAGFDLRNPTQISLADFDRDGDVDILVGTTNMRLNKEQREGRNLNVRLFRNEAGKKQHWIALRLEGGGAGKANRSAIGARVRVTTGKTTQSREIYGGQGHCGHQDDHTLVFGLGKHTGADAITVQWPDKKGSVQTFKNVKADRYYRIRQGHKVEEDRPGG